MGLDVDCQRQPRGSDHWPTRAVGYAGISRRLVEQDDRGNLDISPKTVEVYRANVMAKLQVGSLSELVRFAIRSGMIEG
jgi:hypothetical protein